VKARALVKKNLHTFNDLSDKSTGWEEGEVLEVVASIYGGQVLQVKRGGEQFYTSASNTERVE
jgi:hypothetical protein